MSFQNFRLQATTSQPPAPTPSAHDNVTAGSLLHSVPLGVHHQAGPPHSIAPPPPPQQQHGHGHGHGPNNNNNNATSPGGSPIKDSPTRQPTKAPYGSGDAEDGYTMVFESMEAFEAWREREEEDKMVEFVKGDTHGSKAIPPRFKDHTKLVCARHQRSGRKKYVKKYPDRQRKIPSRKLEGVGCPASISYKTYFESEEVRVMYNDHHSHAIGEANLPFTRRGRRMEVARQKFKASQEVESYSNLPMGMDTQTTGVVSGAGAANGVGSHEAHPSSSNHGVMGQQQPHLHAHAHAHAHSHHGNVGMPTAIAMLAPLPNPMGGGPVGEVSHERWERLEVLFQSIRSHARGGFEYPGPSVAALESVLIRLYLESPVRSGGPGGMSGGIGYGNT